MSLTKVTYSLIADAPINVKDFGAVGDGVADDSNAIIAASAASAGRILLFPAGDYKLSKGVYIESGSTWVGEGKGVSRILIQATFTDHVTDTWDANRAITNRASATNLGFKNMSFVGSGESTTNASKNTVCIRGATGVIVSGCEFTLFGKRSPQIYMQGLVVSSINVVIENSDFTHCSGDGCVAAGDNSDNTVVSGCTAIDNDDWGFVATNATGHVRMIGNYCKDNRYVGMGADECPDVTIIGNVIIGSSLADQFGIRGAIYGPSGYTHQRFNVTGNIIENCRPCISAESFTEGAVISGNQCLNGRIQVARSNNVVVSGNSVKYSSAVAYNEGVLVENFSGTSGSNTITGNNVDGATYGYRELQVGGTLNPSSFIGNSASNCTTSAVSILSGNNFFGSVDGEFYSTRLPEFDQFKVATSATSGSRTLPAQPAGFITAKVGSTDVKVPYYNA